MQSPTALRNPVPAVVGLGLLVAAAMGYSLLTGARMAQRHGPLAHAAMEIKLEAALAHLWLEEGISGGSSEDIDRASEHFDLSARYARAMLEGGETPEGVVVPLRDYALRRAIETVLTQIEETRAIAETRWAAAERPGAGSAMDQRLDAVFVSLLDRANDVEIALLGAMKGDLREFRIVRGLLIALCLGLSALIGVVLRRYAHQQALDTSALRQREEYLSITLDSIGDAVICTDERGCITRANPVAETLTGWSHAEARDRPLNEVFHIVNARTREVMGSPVTRVLREGVIAGLANHSLLIARDGTERQIAESGAPIRDTDGAVIGVVLVFRDVTESYAKDQRLRESEERYRAVAEESPALIRRFLPGGEITYANEAYCKYWQRTSEELVGSSFLPAIPEDERESVMGDISALTVESPSGSHEHHVIAPDGKTRWQRWTTRAIFDAQDEAVAYAAAGEDITERKRAEQKLRVREQQLSLIYESTADVLFYLGVEPGPHYRFLKVNSAFLTATGLSVEQIVGKTVDEVIPEPSLKSVRCNYDKAIREKRIVRWEETSQYPTGSKTGIVGVAPVFDDAGNCTNLVGSVHDITERKRAEEDREHLLHDMGERVKELRCMYGVAESIRKRETLKLLFEEVVALLPPSWQYPEITRCRIRFDDEEFVSQPFKETPWQQSAEVVVAGEARGEIEVFYVQERPERDEGPFLQEERNLLDGVARALSEAVERHHVDMERKRLMLAVEQAMEAVIITDAGGTIQYVNPAFERISGYAWKEAVGQNPRILKSGEHDDAFFRQIWEVLTRRESWQGRIVNKKKDGALYTQETTISPMCDDSGETVNYVSIQHDITQRLRLEEQYHQAQRVESIGRLAGGVAHDLNNLLFPILGYSQMLLDESESDDARRQSLSEILGAGLRARDLVRQLLAFGRKQTLEYRPVDMNMALAGFENLLRRTIREDIAIEIIPAPDAAMVMADIGQIEQVIMNLAVNSQDAMPEGGRLTIETGLAELDSSYAARHEGVQPGTYVMLSVSDTGGGMDAATRALAFEPFFSTKGEQGTGLGLATVYGIVKQHGGNVWVYSEPGEGTTFKVYLPVSEEPLVKEKPSKRGGTDLQGSETILLVEDDEQVRHLAHAILEGQGYTVLQAPNGREALVVLASHSGPVQLLLTDVIMPEMNGSELFAKASESYPDLKVLYMSGYTDDIVARRGVLREGLAFIQKPFTIQALATKIRMALEQE